MNSPSLAISINWFRTCRWHGTVSTWSAHGQHMVQNLQMARHGRHMVSMQWESTDGRLGGGLCARMIGPTWRAKPPPRGTTGSARSTNAGCAPRPACANRWFSGYKYHASHMHGTPTYRGTGTPVRKQSAGSRHSKTPQRNHSGCQGNRPSSLHAC